MKAKPAAAARCCLGKALIVLATCGVVINGEASETNSSPETLLRIDWIGSTQLMADTNAATPLRVLGLPESVTLKEQTLDKLALAPWTLSNRRVDTNASSLLRPLLDDVIASQCRFEVAGTSDQPGACVLAVRLNPERTAVWQTNLARGLELLTGSTAASLPDTRSGWKIECNDSPNCMVFIRSADWTIFGVATEWEALDRVSRRLIASDLTGTDEHSTNTWLRIDADLPRLIGRVAATGDQRPPLPEVTVNVFGDSGRTRTEATLTFAQPLDLCLEPWDIPTHLIDQPCSSMTICRGLPRLLSRLGWWKSLDIAPSPDASFVWAFQGAPMQTYFLLDVPDATNMVNRVTDLVMTTQTNWLTDKASGGFRRYDSKTGFEWQGLPFMSPFLRTVDSNESKLVLGGMFTWLDIVGPIPTNFFDAALSQGEVVYYDWERTDQRIEQWLYMSQFARHVCGKAQVPFESASLLWLKAIDSEVEDTITRINVTAPNQLKLYRTSDLSLTAIELQLLADWFESPTFPKGLHTFTAPPPKPPDGGE